jgi:hypothetical protein
MSHYHPAQCACPPCAHVLILPSDDSQPGGRTRNLATTVCSQCDNPESKCMCEKFCCFCQSQDNVHLCVDGLYYCPDCREACDVRIAETDDH